MGTYSIGLSRFSLDSLDNMQAEKSERSDAGEFEGVRPLNH